MRLYQLTAFAVLMSGAGASADPQEVHRVVTIRNDRGGMIIEYAVRARKLERAGSRVRFAGSCDSACTLLLGLPRNRVCITKEASFGFHLPYGSSRNGNRAAAEYLIRSYPSWVTSWLRANGGLTGWIKRMDYDRLRRHLPMCKTGLPLHGLRS
jgi:hypothetical protein